MAQILLNVKDLNTLPKGFYLFHQLFNIFKKLETDLTN